MERSGAPDEDLIDAIYEAGAVPDGWPAVLDALAAQVDARAAALIALDGKGRLRAAATPRYEQSLAAFLASGLAYDNIRPRRALEQQYAGFLTDLELCTPQELAEDFLYRRFIFPYGLGWTSGAVMPTPAGEQLVFDIAREAGAEPFTRADMQVLDTYRPHLARAALLTVRLGQEEARTRTGLMQTMGLAAAALSGEGRVLAANARFEALAPLITAGAFDRVTMADRSASALLAAAMSRLEAGLATAPGSFPVGGRGRRGPLIAHLLPVRRSARDLVARMAALMLVTPVRAEELPATDLLSGLFDLTPAEARVARAVTNGATLAELAAAGRVSIETLRSQIKSVMRKTGTRRQVDLVRLLLSARPIGGADPANPAG